ncbi:hypothetical protein [Streptomyces sp. NPDC047525]|uniref:hypothetical protein n=1 Tax=Streptomyces sp. NPDC047525 TaxID=3155264 RepID=UPI00340FCAAB
MSRIWEWALDVEDVRNRARAAAGNEARHMRLAACAALCRYVKDVAWGYAKPMTATRLLAGEAARSYRETRATVRV